MKEFWENVSLALDPEWIMLEMILCLSEQQRTILVPLLSEKIS